MIDQIMSAAGVDLYYGRRLFGEVRTHKLIDLAAEGRVLMVHGGTPNAQELRLTAEQLLSQGTTSAELLSEQERSEYLALLERPDFVWMGQMIMAVWGRR